MALPQAFGFMPLQEAWTQNWEQSPTWSPDEMAALDLDLARRAQQQRFAAMPGGRAMQNRWMSPNADALLNQVAAPPQQPQLSEAELAALMGNLKNAVAQDDDSMMANISGRSRLFQGSGNLASQPWFDEYIALAKGGGDLPMIHGQGGTPLSDEAKAGIAQRRAARLAKGAPALSLEDRKKNVMNNAIAQGEQRAVRMGDMSRNQQWLNEMGRFFGGQQVGDPQFMMDSMLYGVDAAQGKRRLDLAAQEGEANRAAAAQEAQRQEALEREKMAQQAKLAADEMGVRREIAGMEQGVKLQQLAQEGDLTRQQRIAAMMADPNFFPGMPYDRKLAEAERMIPPTVAPSQPGTPAASATTTPTASPTGGMRQFNLTQMVTDPSAHSAGFEQTFLNAKKQYPDITAEELAALWEQNRGYDPYSAAGEIPLIPYMIYDKLDNDAYPEYASHVRMRRLNRAMGYEPGEGFPNQLGMLVPPGYSWLMEWVAQNSPFRSSQQQP